MKKFLIAGNWKMNKTSAEAAAFAKKIKALRLENEAELAIIAPFTQLASLKNALSGSEIKIGAQNVHYEKSGAFTGEISIPMLEEIGIDYCVIGHSERREYYNESDDTVNLKLKALLDSSITPILCVGESLEVREAGNEQSFVGDQICADFEGIESEKAKKVIIAYEPIWAIGTGKTASPEQAEDMCAFIRGMLSGLYGEDVSSEMIIQYGGSMKPENAYELLSKPNINGGLIGGASLEPDSLAEIARAAYKIESE